jgi:hypothetical protein
MNFSSDGEFLPKEKVGDALCLAKEKRPEEGALGTLD